MALEAVFRKLHMDSQELHDALHQLRTTIAEDRPLHRPVLVFVESLTYVLDDLVGRMVDVVQAAAKAARSVESETDLQFVRRTLTDCHEQFLVVTETLTERLSSPERISELIQVARRRRREWKAWAETVRGQISRCHDLLNQLNRSLFQSWQELSERIGSTWISARAIGQITVPEGEPLPRESVT